MFFKNASSTECSDHSLEKNTKILRTGVLFRRDVIKGAIQKGGG